MLKFGGSVIVVDTALKGHDRLPAKFRTLPYKLGIIDNKKWAFMKIILGILMIISGIILGLYVGVWPCFIGGIVQVIDQIRAIHMDTRILAMGIAKIIFVGIIGSFCGGILIILGFVILSMDTGRRRKA